VAGTTAVQAMRAELLTGTLKLAVPPRSLARLRTIWPSWPRHCSTSSGGASQVEREVPSLKYTASMVTVSPGAAEGRSSRYDTPAVAAPARPMARAAARVRRVRADRAGRLMVIWS